MSTSYSYHNEHLEISLYRVERSSNQDDESPTVRATFSVRVLKPELEHTSRYPGVAEYVLAALPKLASHKCQSGKPRSMATELADTELVHLLEHVVLEHLALQGIARTSCRGETAWNHVVDGPGVYRLRISAPVDDIAIQQALESAVNLVGRYLSSLRFEHKA